MPASAISVLRVVGTSENNKMKKKNREQKYDKTFRSAVEDAAQIYIQKVCYSRKPSNAECSKERNGIKTKRSLKQ